MKKILCLVLCFALIFASIGCKKAEEPQKQEEVKTAEASADTKEPIKDDSNDPVTITIMGGLFYEEELTEESLSALVASKGYISGTLNTDGTAAVVMTKAQQKEYVSEIAGKIRDVLDKAKDDETTGANIESVKANDDFSVFTVALTSGKLTLYDYMMAMVLPIYGAAYALAAGKTEVNPRVDYTDAAGTKITSTADDDFGNDLNLFEDDEEDEFAPSDLANVVLVDNDELYAELVSISTNDSWNYSIDIDLVNKGTKNLNVYLQKESINDWSITSYFGTHLDPGQETTETVRYSKSDIKMAGITDPTRIQFTVSAVDEENWDDDPVVTEECVVYPLGEENDKEYEYAPSGKDYCVCDNEYAAMYILADELEASEGYTLQFFIENKSDSTLAIGWNGVTVNDWSADTFFNVSVAPHKRAMSEARFYVNELEELGITEVRKIEFDISIIDEDDWTNWDNLYTGGRAAVYPQGKDAYTYAPREALDTDLKSDDTDKYTFTAMSFGYDEWENLEFKYYVENKLNKTIVLAFDEVLINGADVNTGYYTWEIPAGQRKVESVGFYEEELQELGIEKAETLTITYSAYDENDYEMEKPLYTATMVVVE